MSDPIVIQGGAMAMAVRESDHDTFDNEKVVNWLANSAGLGVFAHGRIHQQSGNAILVGDLIHKRGFLLTDDLLKMTEQALDSMGEPLVIRSSYGRLLALAMLPTMGTANGEGDLVAYYEGGVAFFNTHIAPRETIADTDGKILQAGWDQKRQIDYRLNRISAVGRYAVAVLPRDHFFRSQFGLHLLRLVLGDGSIQTEQLNTVSTDIQPILAADDRALLPAAACGFWLHGNRMLCTTGLAADESISAAGHGRGVVSWNQATTFTEDGTPVPRWEGLWVFDDKISGLHWLGETGIRPEPGTFGFLATGEAGLYFGAFDQNALCDTRDGEEIAIEWDLETGCFPNNDRHLWKKLSGGSIEVELSGEDCRVRVLVRTDVKDQWVLWKEFSPGDRAKRSTQAFHMVEDLGAPPSDCAKGTWFQVRVEGLGAAEIWSIDLDISAAERKTGRQDNSLSGAPERDFFEINSEPVSKRWPISR